MSTRPDLRVLIEHTPAGRRDWMIQTYLPDPENPADLPIGAVVMPRSLWRTASAEDSNDSAGWAPEFVVWAIHRDGVPALTPIPLPIRIDGNGDSRIDVGTTDAAHHSLALLLTLGWNWAYSRWRPKGWETVAPATTLPVIGALPSFPGMAVEAVPAIDPVAESFGSAFVEDAVGAFDRIRTALEDKRVTAAERDRIRQELAAIEKTITETHHG